MERYAVELEDGQEQIQVRNRESWRANDGWAWARQQGYDPARFILHPDGNWRLFRAAPPNGDEMAKVLRKMAAEAPQGQKNLAQFEFVVDLFGVETLPVGALPDNYRKAIIDALIEVSSVTSSKNSLDPLNRRSLRISYKESKSEVTNYLYLDHSFQYLGSVQKVGGRQVGSRLVVERRKSAEIPVELLRELGNKREPRALWG